VNQTGSSGFQPLTTLRTFTGLKKTRTGHGTPAKLSLGGTQEFATITDFKPKLLES
jgi:hypothetical protein